MSSVHIARTLTDGVISVLTAAGLTIGDAEIPAAGGWAGEPGKSAFTGYAVVHGIPGGVTDGPIDGTDEDATAIYQVSSFGATRANAEAVGDLVRSALLSGTITSSGRKVLWVHIDMLGQSYRDDTVQPPLWRVDERYRIATTPA